jgi:hypothetical protein
MNEDEKRLHKIQQLRAARQVNLKESLRDGQSLMSDLNEGSEEKSS